MRVEMKWVIVINEGENKLVNEAEGIYSLIKEGYCMYPLDVPLNVFRGRASKIMGSAVVKEVKMVENKTEILYQMVSLQSVN